MSPNHISNIECDGFSIVPKVFDSQTTNEWLQQLDDALNVASGAIKGRRGKVRAARNILSEFPISQSLWRVPLLDDLLKQVLGHDYVLVRVLYFDKHPDRTWTLPWHKDMTIAVKDNQIKSPAFSKPTNKSGVPHVEASTELLQNMLTLRIHLDDVTEENGPLEVVAGSHLNGKLPESDRHQSQKILVDAGDVLAMRPLVSHASASSAVGTLRHRRILHFEFSGDRVLPDGYRWYYADDRK